MCQEMWGGAATKRLRRLRPAEAVKALDEMWRMQVRG